MWRTYCYQRIRNDEKEFGVTSGDSPQKAMTYVLGSHPKNYGITWAKVYVPGTNLKLEWTLEECS